MPCNADYMAPNEWEREYSKVLCLLAELDGKEWTTRQWKGYHEEAYCKQRSHELLDEATVNLCSRLQETDVTQYSLEMQIWWRDHQKADRLRVERELKRHKEAADRQHALAKLTDYERRLLGL